MANWVTAEQKYDPNKMDTWERNFPTASKRATAHIRRYANGDQRLGIKGSQEMNKPDFLFTIQKAMKLDTHEETNEQMDR